MTEKKKRTPKTPKPGERKAAPPVDPVNPDEWRPKGQLAQWAEEIPVTDDLVYDIVGHLNRRRAVLLADKVTAETRRRLGSDRLPSPVLLPTDDTQIAMLTSYGLAVASNERAAMLALLDHVLAPLVELAKLASGGSFRDSLVLAYGVLDLAQRAPELVEHHRGPAKQRKTIFPDLPTRGPAASSRTEWAVATADLGRRPPF